MTPTRPPLTEDQIDELRRLAKRKPRKQTTLSPSTFKGALQKVTKKRLKHGRATKIIRF